MIGSDKFSSSIRSQLATKLAAVGDDKLDAEATGSFNDTDVFASAAGGVPDDIPNVEAPAAAPDAPPPAPADGESDDTDDSGDGTDAPPAPNAAAQGAAAADDWEEFEVEEAPGISYKIKAPKAQKSKIAEAYLRRADYDRKRGRLGKHESFLEPMITSGQFDAVAPMLSRASTDQEFANFVAAAYQRRLSGLPLSFADQQVLTQVDREQGQARRQVQEQAASPSLEDLIAAVDSDADIDPLTQLGIKKHVLPHLQRYAAEQDRITRQLDAQNREREQATQQQAQTQQYQQWEAAERTKAHQLLMQTYPGQFRGDQADWPALNEILEYGKQGGYIAQYGIPGGMALAKRLLDEARVASTPSSPLADIAVRGKAAAAAAAANVAGKAIVGSAAQQRGNAAPPAKIAVKTQDGKPRSIRAIVGDALRTSRTPVA